jgi:hypothetical protein
MESEARKIEAPIDGPISQTEQRALKVMIRHRSQVVVVTLTTNP